MLLEELGHELVPVRNAVLWIPWDDRSFPGLARGGCGELRFTRLAGMRREDAQPRRSSGPVDGASGQAYGGCDS